MIDTFHRRRQYSTPLHIDKLNKGGTALALERIEFSHANALEDSHDERWLQNLIFEFPNVLPTAELDPGLGALVPICIELPLKSGFVDNLYITGDGDIVIVECKLWRNPEARREVVAQIIDYAHGLASWNYQDLNTAVIKGILPDGSNTKGTLFEIVAANTDIDEIRFVDAVSRNLRLGRLLLLLVGDGIREGAETLSGYLQMHAGFHFTLGLVEMPIFRLPVGGFIVQPRILARTVNIERGIVRVVEGRALVEKVPDGAALTSQSSGITQDRIIESIAAIVPGFGATLDAFNQAANKHGIFLEPARRSIMVRWPGPNETMFTVGGFSDDGTFITYSINWRANELGLIDVAHAYLEKIAELVGGSVKKTEHPSQWYVISAVGRKPMAMDLLSRGDKWIPLILEYGKNLEHAIQTRTDKLRVDACN